MPRKKLKIKKSESGYLDIGHTVFSKGPEFYNKENPNYVWGYKEGKVSKWTETPECMGHADVPHWHAGGWLFWGRYDAKSKKISCVISYLGANTFRNIPKTIISQLEQSFPNAVAIIIFD